MIQRILVVEDEPNLQDAIRLNLEMDGYEVESVDNGRKAFEKFKSERFDLFILDIMLPEMDGLQLCRQIRLRDTDTPILFLTAKDTSKDVINGLKVGADDYLTKPFNLEEFLLRVKVLMRHSVKGTDKEKELQTYSFGGNEVHFNTYQAKGVNGDVKLTKKEMMLLRLLIQKNNEVVSRQEILQNVWGYDVYPSTRTIDNFILSFRKYFEDDPKNPQYFHSVRGIGYKFTN